MCNTKTCRCKWQPQLLNVDRFKWPFKYCINSPSLSSLNNSQNCVNFVLWCISYSYLLILLNKYFNTGHFLPSRVTTVWSHSLSHPHLSDCRQRDRVWSCESDRVVMNITQSSHLLLWQQPVSWDLEAKVRVIKKSFSVLQSKTHTTVFLNFSLQFSVKI